MSLKHGADRGLDGGATCTGTHGVNVHATSHQFAAAGRTHLDIDRTYIASEHNALDTSRSCCTGRSDHERGARNTTGQLGGIVVVIITDLIVANAHRKVNRVKPDDSDHLSGS